MKQPSNTSETRPNKLSGLPPAAKSRAQQRRIQLLVATLSSVPALLLAADINVTAGAVDTVINGNCSLREAFEAAQTNAAVDACLAGDPDSNATADRIILPANSSFSLADTNCANKLGTVVSSRITIVGNNSTVSSPTISGRLMDISAAQGYAAEVRIENLTVDGFGSPEYGGPCNNDEGDADGGAIRARNKGDDPADLKLTLTNSTLSNNRANGYSQQEPDGEGGYYYFEHPADGGAIKAQGATLTITSSVIRDNMATMSDSSGGAIRADDSIVEITGSNIINNSANGLGGGVVVRGGSELIITNSQISDNFAGQSGGGINFYSDGNLEIVRSTLSTNSANRNGGGVRFSSSDAGGLEVVDSTIADNSAQIYGGGLYMDGEGTALIKNSTFATNSAAEGDGGGIYTSLNTTIENSTLSGNSADTYGGAIYVGTADLTVNNSTLSGNMASSGAAIQTGSSSNNDYMLQIANSTLANNSASFSGGSIALIGHTLDMRGSLLTGNSTGNENSDGCFIDGNLEEISNTLTTDAGDECANFGATTRTAAQVGLGALADNGGRTQTHALPMSSVAVDFVTAGECTDTEDVNVDADQRGSGRPVDGDADGTARCDAGAFEFSQLGLTFSNNQTLVSDTASFNQDIVLLDVSATTLRTGSENILIEQVTGDLRGDISTEVSAGELNLRLLVDSNNNGVVDASDPDISNNGTFTADFAAARYSFTFSDGMEQSLIPGTTTRFLVAANIGDTPAVANQVWSWTQSAVAAKAGNNKNPTSIMNISLGLFALGGLFSLWLIAGALPGQTRRRARAALGVAMIGAGITACGGSSSGPTAGSSGVTLSGDVQLTLDGVQAKSAISSTSVAAGGLEIVGTMYTISE